MIRVCNNELTVNGHLIARFPHYLTGEVLEIVSHFMGRLDNPTTREELRYKIDKLVDTHNLDDVWNKMMKDPLRFYSGRHLPVWAAPQKPKQVLFSGPKTIVFWPDGTKTMVSLAEGEEYDEYGAFCAAVVKKIFGSTHKAKKFLESVKTKQAPKAKKKEESEQMDLFLDYNANDTAESDKNMLTDKGPCEGERC